jgi:hypothetical protein
MGEPGATKVQGSLLKLFAEPVVNFSSIHSYDSFGAEGLFEEKCLEGVSAMKRRCTMGLVFLLIGVHPFSLMAMPNPDTGPGCGLGKNLWEGWKGQKQIAPQVFMSSTNVTGSYSFAISSGTSGCSHDGRIWDSERANLFIGINYASLSEDMARGGGEHLASLATLMHVPLEQQPEFFAMVQKRYVYLVHYGEDDPVLIQEALREASIAYTVLAKQQIGY